MRFQIVIIGLLLCIISSIPWVSFAQNLTIKGIIRDGSDMHLLAIATIQLKDISNSNTIGYTFSDTTGRYMINVNIKGINTLLLIVSYLGYKRDTVAIPRHEFMEKMPSLIKDFALLQDNKLLDAIYIKSYNAIQVSRDTTTYRVESFISPEDKNLESVLKKMPGIEVKGDGTLYFKNKKISKILLEGDDLTGERYKIISQNLKPEMAMVL